MPNLEEEAGQNDYTDWQAPEAPTKPSRFRKALDGAKNLGETARDGAKNTTEVALASAREKLGKAYSGGKDIATRVAEKTDGLKDSTLQTFENLRVGDLASTIGGALTSEKARQALASLPVAGGLLRIIEGGVGTKLTGDKIGFLNRVRSIGGGVKDLTVDGIGGAAVRSVKITATLLNLGPDAIMAIGDALTAKDIQVGKTIRTIGELASKHPKILAILTGRLFKK